MTPTASYDWEYSSCEGHTTLDQQLLLLKQTFYSRAAADFKTSEAGISSRGELKIQEVKKKNPTQSDGGDKRNDDKKLVHQGQETLEDRVWTGWTGRTGGLEEDGQIFDSSLRAVRPSTPENVTSLMLASLGSVQPGTTTQTSHRTEGLGGWGSETRGTESF